MNLRQTIISPEKLNKALKRLELLSDPSSQVLLQELDNSTNHLPTLSKQLRESPYRLKKRLDELKDAGFVYSPKRFPNGYAVNQLHCLKVGLKVKKLAVVDEML